MDCSITHFNSEIESLSCYYIEEAIANYFNMGNPDNSEIPQEMMENQSEKCILIGTKKSGTFNITNYKLKNGKYALSVTLVGKLSNI